MTPQGVMRYDQGNTHKKFPRIHRRPASLDGDQLGHRHRHVVVNSPPQELPAKIDERIQLNHNLNGKEEEQRQLRKSVWDCDSSLYDSFELDTFSGQLNRAIVAASSTPSALVNGHDSIGGIRSLSMPHYVFTNGHERQYSTVNKEEISRQEEKLRSMIVEGNTHQITIHDRHQTVAQNEVERQLDTRQTVKMRNKKMGFPRYVKRLFTRLISMKLFRKLQVEKFNGN